MSRRRRSRSARPTSCGSAARSCARSPAATTTAARAATTWRTFRAPRARTSATRSRARARRRAVVGAHRLQPRPDPLSRGRGARVPAPSSSPRSPTREQVDAAVDVLVHYAGWTDKFHAVLGGVNPVAAPFLSLLPARADRGGGGASRPTSRAARAGRRDRAGARGRQHRRGDPVGARPLAGLDLGEVLGVSDIPRRRGQPAGGPPRRAGTALGGHRDLNAIVDAAGDAELAPSSTGWLPRRSSARATRAAATSYDAGRRRRAGAHRGRHRAEDGLAPGRRVAPDRA